jgi:hypothetical protein
MRAAAHESRTGDLLSARYELHEVLESAEFYDTYRATDRKSSRTVSVKLLRPELALRSKVVQGFVSAPKTLTGLRHPNVSHVLAVESDEIGIPFVVEEHVVGEPLSSSIARFPGGMPVGGAITMIAPVVEAMAAAHALGLAHGRLDSEHVVLAKQGGTSVPKVVRFAAGDEHKPDAVGNPRLAPELRDGKAVADARSDVWAIGALLYETLSGERPGASIKDHVPLDERSPHLPSELSQLVERCLCSEPAKRFSQAGAVQQALALARKRLQEGAAAGGAPARGPAAPPKPAARPAPAPPPPARPFERKAPISRKVEPPPLGRNASAPAPEQAFAATVAADEPPAPMAKARDLGGATTDPALEDSFEASFAELNESARPAPEKRGVDPAAAQRLKLGLSATMVQVAAPAAPASVIPLPFASPGPQAGSKRRAVSTRPPSGDLGDEPELTLESMSPRQALQVAAAADQLAATVASEPRQATTRSAPMPPPLPSAPELRTLGDLAAAFEPMEGADQIGQGEAEGTARARAFRSSLEGDQGDARGPAAASARGEKAAQRPANERRSKVGPPPLGSVKQLREANKVTARGVSPEQLRDMRERSDERARTRDRILGELLFFLFAFALLFAIPLLWDETRTKAQALFGERTKLAMGGFAVLSVVAMIRTWALQIQARPFMLRPVTISLRVVTASVCALCAGFFLPAGALGPAEAVARYVLPWGCGAFYFSFGLYGLLRGVRDAASAPIYGVLIALIYSGGFVGSYRALAMTVLSKSRHGHAARGVIGVMGVGSVMGQLNKMATGGLKVTDAGTDEKMIEQHQVGASESEDMRGVEQLEQSRKRKSAQFESLGKDIHKIAR